MTDVFSKRKRSEVMRAVKGKNTKLEIHFRKALWRRGFRYSTNSKLYFGTPDIVLRKYKAVIFVDSCFWHGCGKHFGLPAVRVRFWREKIEKNKLRDKTVTSFYRKKGWTVFRFWEHDIKRATNRLVDKIVIRLGIDR
jgi:DNA mismatch endonuclease (patch repair protein)